ncbi:hypothetical protein SOV_38910 [Sporomusa ovata DSM 2662]|uniref:Possible uridine kinase n=1 Tax=Sporomusa ovata TaxID=2378 RepID=A0A0U1KSW9_9FIRM|nr:hypothetical protein [Sporomusa ovata]EQB26279.1 uridine kinase [Sporomusa ovata DSM 2662]CQR70355.1 Possible uridine kinase [Sporomusa ovata]
MVYKGAKKPIIVAKAAVSGGGKTTITRELCKQLTNVKVLSFDDYDFDVANGLEDICEWVDNGADYKLWKLGPLATDIRLLLSKENQNLDYILLDYPFAYKNEEIAQFIDYAIFIDTPLDIAMARRSLRDFANKSIEEVCLELNDYLTHGRAAYLEIE